MRSVAIIVGIDEYTWAPLTSAVTDALRFEKALIKLKLILPEEVTKFTSPVTPKARPATAANILNTLFSVYDSADEIGRFFFFFSGHGLLAFSDAVRSRTTTALIPTDVENIKRDGRLLIDVKDLLDRMELVGPQEQFYFIDSCRDLNYDSMPDVGPVGWGETNKLGAARSQSTLYAVSPMGQARGTKGGLGVMTSHLLQGLDGNGLGLEYDPFNDQYVVTAASIYGHVFDQVEASVENEPLWKRKYQLPQFLTRGPSPRPLRVIDPPPKVSFAIHIQPDIAGAQTEIKLSLNRVPLSNDYCYPPRQNHEAITLIPQPYIVTAKSSAGQPTPERAVIDLRKVKSATIEVVTPAHAPPLLPAAKGLLSPSIAFSQLSPRSLNEPGAADMLHDDRPPPHDDHDDHDDIAHADSGPHDDHDDNHDDHVGHDDMAHTEPAAAISIVRAEAYEPQVVIELESLGSPHQKWEAAHRLEQRVLPGAYHIQFRLGPDVFNEKDIIVEAGEEVRITPTASLPLILREALNIENEIPTTVVVSETIGTMQAGLLDTILPMIGVKPFDQYDELFHRFGNLVEKLVPEDFALRPVSLVIAVDGNSWNVPANEVVNGIRARTISGDGEIGSFRPLALSRGTLDPIRREDAIGLGFERIGLAVTTAPSANFTLEIESKSFGRIRLACISIVSRVTVVTITLSPDGAIDVSQSLLRIPGRPYPAELVPMVPLGKMIRQIQMGQKLYRSGELVTRGVTGYDDISREMLNLLHAKWTDPILSCMAYFGWSQLAASDSEKKAEADWLLRDTARNLNLYFGEVPDSKVIYGLANPSIQAEIFNGLIRSRVMPVLAEGARILARYAINSDLREAPIVRLAREIAPEQTWSLTIDDEFNPN